MEIFAASAILIVFISSIVWGSVRNRYFREAVIVGLGLLGAVGLIFALAWAISVWAEFLGA